MWAPIRSLAKHVLGPELRETAQAVENQRILHEASIAQLKQEFLDQHKRDYLLISGSDQATHFDRETLGKIVAHCRALALRNPLVQRAIDVMVLYVFGQGVTIAMDEGDEKRKTKSTDQTNLERFLDDPRNRAELFGAEGLEYAEREINATGNLFVLLYGRKRGPGIPQIRTAPFEEFQKIVCNPDDREEPWYYLRETKDASGKPRKVYHPDWLYQPANKLPKYDDIEVAWDIPVAHYRIGGFGHWSWGLPKLYAAGDWATAYKTFLEDLATVIKSLSRYAHKLTMKGASPTQVSNAAVALRSSLVDDISQSETKPTPAAGSTWVQSDQASLEPFKASGMHVDGDSGRRLMLMFAAGMGLPETFFADLSNSNLATAKALDRPTELLFLMRQELWRRVLSDIAAWGVREMQNRGAMQNKGDLPAISVEFPSILEHDVAESVAGTIAALTLDGKKLSKLFTGAERDAAKMILLDLGIDDPTDILDRIEKAGGFEPDEEPEIDPNQPPPPQPGMQSEARVIRMFEKIRKRIEENAA